MQGGPFRLKINKCAYKFKNSRYLIVLFPCLLRRGFFFETPRASFHVQCSAEWCYRSITIVHTKCAKILFDSHSVLESLKGGSTLP